MIKFFNKPTNVLLILLFIPSATLLYEHYIETQTPNFRGANDSVPLRRKTIDCCRHVNTTGLDNINLYGSGIINFPHFLEHFKNTLSTNKENFVVVNLNDEEIFYYKNRSLQWYALGYTKKNYGQKLNELRFQKRLYRKVINYFYGPVPLDDQNQINTEEDIFKALNITYLTPLKNELAWLDNDDFMENTIRLFQSFKRDTHLYVHCLHGRGRTTTYLILYDIFRNADKVSVEDIANRHFCLGRENVMDTEVWSKKGSWTKEALMARKTLVIRFHNYMTDPRGYQYQSWTQWKKEKGYSIDNGISVHVGDQPKAMNPPKISIDTDKQIA